MKTTLQLVLLLLGLSSFAQERTLVTDKKNYELGEVINIKFSWHHDVVYDSIQQVDLSDFKIKNKTESITYSSGKMTKASSCRMEAYDSGTYVIESPVYYFKGKAFRAAPVKIQVTAPQEYESIKKEFKKYTDHIAAKDFEASMEYLLPEFFDIFPRSHVVKIMEESFDAPEAEIDFKKFRILNIDEPRKVKGKYYASMRYMTVMTMKPTVVAEIEPGSDEMKLAENLITLALEKTFGSKNVKYIKKRGFYEIKSVTDAYAVSKKGKSDWKFLVLEREYKLVLEKLIPKEMFSKI
ncbi:hypothetical protein [Pseudotamlana carrageenivorans]|uniref:DUF4198 domain-containing protein n=1 Tax=Pseudotamlana carrageenivorans TaxID=2069432 RepID=A0A2I7SHI0_9FLAO|nr:hypothetical protein [Tamlana carrageenivorans]AUS05352.1 hypothetical protein C1A40_07615 [Tamlana carrageenivorans]